MIKNELDYIIEQEFNKNLLIHKQFGYNLKDYYNINDIIKMKYGNILRSDGREVIVISWVIENIIKNILKNYKLNIENIDYLYMMLGVEWELIFSTTLKNEFNKISTKGKLLYE